MSASSHTATLCEIRICRGKQPSWIQKYNVLRATPTRVSTSDILRKRCCDGVSAISGLGLGPPSIHWSPPRRCCWHFNGQDLKVNRHQKCHDSAQPRPGQGADEPGRDRRGKGATTRLPQLQSRQILCMTRVSVSERCRRRSSDRSAARKPPCASPPPVT